MLKENLVNHLQNQNCTAHYDNYVGEKFTMWRNIITGDKCQVPLEDVYGGLTCCHIFFMLRIDPPNDMEDMFTVYSNFMRANSYSSSRAPKIDKN